MLFSRKSESQGSPEREPPAAPEERPASHSVPDSAPAQSFIDASLTILGDLHSEGDVQVDGRICGNVTCAQLIVGRDADITGTVKAAQAIVRGSITGTVRASVVILQETARVKSDIAYTQLTIDDGAQFEGAVHRSESPLDATDTAAALTELEQLVGTGSTGAAAGPASTSREPRGEPAAGGAATPERHAVNGHADAR